MLHFKVHLRFHLKKHEKIAKKCEEKDAFHVAVDGPLDGAIKVAPSNFKVCSLCVPCILYRAIVYRNTWLGNTIIIFVIQQIC